MKGKAGIIIAGVIAVILLGVGGFVYTKSFMSKSTQNNSEIVTGKPTQKASTIFSSIQDALSKNLSIQCNFKETNGNQTTTYIKNGMIRADVKGKTAADSGTVIMRDGKMYFWNDKSAIVLSFDMKEIQENAAEGVSAGSANQNPQNYLAMMEKYKESCKTAVVSDSLFIIPTTVKFQDVSQMMKSLQNSAGSGSADSTVGVPSINPTNYQQMMQQYQNAVEN